MLKIKYTISFAILLILSAGCGKLSENTFLLKGEVSNYPSEKIYFSYTDGQDNYADSCIVKNGKFSFQGTIDEPLLVRLSDKKYRQGKNRDYKVISFYIEPTKMTFTADWSVKADTESTLPLYYLSGSSLNQEASIYKKMTSQGNSTPDSIARFIQLYPDSFLSVRWLNHYSSWFSTEDLERMCDILTEKAKSYSPYRELQQKLAAIYAVQPGKPSIDFSFTDIHGNDYKLSDFKGHVILLDFWASWCVPCRASMPHVKEIHKKYKDSGLVVICIADDDLFLDKWKSAIEKDGTSDFIHTLRGLKQLEDGSCDQSNDISKLYTVHEIPSKFIIDADGVIAGIKMSDANLDGKLKELFGF